MRGFIRTAVCAATVEHLRVRTEAVWPLRPPRAGRLRPHWLGLWLIATGILPIVAAAAESPPSTAAAIVSSRLMRR